MTSLRSRTRVCRHTVVCGRLTGGMGPGASPGASPFLPSAFFGGVGFCCGAPPGAPAFCFPAVCGACFLGGAPGGLADVSGGCSAFFLRGALSGIVVPYGCLRRQVLCAAF